MNLTQIRSFLAVIDTGSFAAAAKDLGISQPAVSQHIRKLEESLQVCLIKRGAVCTASKRAEEFVRHARTYVETSQRAQQSLYSDELRVGASSNVGTYLIQPFFARFLEEEGITGKLNLDTNPAVSEKLRRGEIDLAAMEWWQDPEPNTQRFQSRT
ncbi:MAG: LysR family transcriptional regulator [Verrucomicrobiota bacterium]